MVGVTVSCQPCSPLSASIGAVLAQAPFARYASVHAMGRVGGKESAHPSFVPTVPMAAPPCSLPPPLPQAGGVADNVLPKSATVKLNFRTLPGELCPWMASVAFRRAPPSSFLFGRGTGAKVHWRAPKQSRGWGVGPIEWGMCIEQSVPTLLVPRHQGTTPPSSGSTWRRSPTRSAVLSRRVGARSHGLSQTYITRRDCAPAQPA